MFLHKYQYYKKSKRSNSKMAKYHINLKGEVAICRAMEHCPLGGAHFDHQAKAIEYADRMNEAVINSKLPARSSEKR